MAVRSTTVNVGTTAVALVSDNDADTNPGFRDIGIRNTGSASVYLGGSNVTTGNGFALAAGESITMGNVASGSIPWAVVASGTVAVSVLEVGV